MTITINGTTGISGVDGSSGTPAYQGNDANTGISFGTDIVTINTGGTARVTTDASGNVGIGTSSPYSFAGAKTLQLTATDYSLLQQSVTTSTANNGNWRQIVRGSIGSHVYQLQLMNDANSAEQSVYEVSRSANSVSYQRWFGGTSEAMRIDSSGNVGIGTVTTSNVRLTSNAATASWAGTFYANSGGASTTGLSVYGLSFGGNYSNGSAEVNIVYGSAGAGLDFSSYNGTTVTPRMRIDSSGNVGIGGIPRSLLYLGGGNEGTGEATYKGQLTLNAFSATLNASGIGIEYKVRADSNGFGWRTTAYHTGSTTDYVFQTRQGSASWTEVMRIDGSGNLLVGATSTNPIADRVNGIATGPVGFLTSRGSNNMALGLSGTSGTNITFYTDNGSTYVTAGNITSNGSVTAFNTSSDYRMKENVQSMFGALDTVLALKPVTYTWKPEFAGTNPNGQGFIAHELQEVVPDCVTGEKDAVDANGKPQYQGVDTSFLVATLVSAIQELTARLEALENK